MDGEDEWGVPKKGKGKGKKVAISEPGPEDGETVENETVLGNPPTPKESGQNSTGDSLDEPGPSNSTGVSRQTVSQYERFSSFPKPPTTYSTPMTRRIPMTPPRTPPRPVKQRRAALSSNEPERFESGFGGQERGFHSVEGQPIAPSTQTQSSGSNNQQRGLPPNVQGNPNPFQNDGERQGNASSISNESPKTPRSPQNDPSDPRFSEATTLVNSSQSSNPPRVPRRNEPPRVAAAPRGNTRITQSSGYRAPHVSVPEPLQQTWIHVPSATSSNVTTPPTAGARSTQPLQPSQPPQAPYAPHPPASPTWTNFWPAIWAWLSSLPLIWAFITIFIILSLIWFFAGNIIRWTGGSWYYTTHWIYAVLGDDEMSEPCYRILQEEGRDPWSRLSMLDWFLYKRCKGNRDGFGAQGQVGRLCWDWVWGWFGPSPGLTLVVMFGVWYKRAWFVNNVDWSVGQLTEFTRIVEGYVWRRTLGVLAVLAVIFLLWNRIISLFYTLLVIGLSLFIYFTHNFFEGLWITLTTEPAQQPSSRQNSPTSPQPRRRSRADSFWDFMRDSLPVSFRRLSYPSGNNCIHKDPCHCFDEATQLRDETQHLSNLLTILSEENRTLFEKLHDTQVQNIEYKHRADLCAQYHSTPISPRVEAPWPDQRARRKIERLEHEKDILLAEARKMKTEYEDQLLKMHAQVNYARGSYEEKSATQTALKSALSHIRVMKEEEAKRILTTEELRRQLTMERANHSEKCQQPAKCQMVINELEYKNGVVLEAQNRYDQLVRQSAVTLGVKEADARKIRFQQYIEKVTLEILRYRQAGGDVVAFSSAEVEILRGENERMSAYVGRLEREVERLGGSWKEVELGLDTTRPRATRMVEMTYEENAERVFSMYDKLCDMLITLENLYVKSSLQPPPWIVEKGRENLIYLDEYPPQDPASVSWPKIYELISNGQKLKPKYPTLEIVDVLCERLVIAEMQRLYNRVQQLLHDIRSQLKHTPPSPHTVSILQEGDIVLKEVLGQVLDYIPILYHSSAQLKPENSPLKKFRIWNNMQIAIVELTRCLIWNQRDPGLWPSPPLHLLPNSGRNRRASVSSLHANLLLQELSTLESRIIQLFSLMAQFQIPGTLMGPQLQRLQSNSTYEHRFGSTLVSKHFAELCIAHFRRYVEESKIYKVVDAQGIAREVKVPHQELLPLNWEEYRRVGLGLKEAVEKKERDEEEWPRFVRAVLRNDALRGPVLEFQATEDPSLTTARLLQEAQSKSSTSSSSTQTQTQQTKEYQEEKQKWNELKTRVEQLKDWVQYKGVAKGMAMPQTGNLRKNASLDYLRRANEKHRDNVNMLTQQLVREGVGVPRSVGKGGKMWP